MGQASINFSSSDEHIIDERIFEILILKDHKGFHKSKRKSPVRVRIPVVFTSFHSNNSGTLNNLKWPLLGVENFNWKAELDEEELRKERRRYFLKRLSRFQSSPGVNAELNQQRFPSDCFDSLNALKKKIFQTHKGVAPRYLQKYLDEFFICHLFRRTHDPFDWLLNCAIQANW